MKRPVFLGLLIFSIFRGLAFLLIPPGSEETLHLYIANDIARFVQFPIYFYQQQYMGPLESYLFAPLLRIFGFSFWAGRFYNSLLFISFAAVYLLMVRRVFGQNTARHVFFALCLLPFPALFFTTVIGWTEILLLASIALALLLKVAEVPRKSRGSCLALGIVCGLALWCQPIFIVWLVPLVIGLIGVVPGGRRWRALASFLLGFFAGLLPVWIHFFQTGSLVSMKGASASSSQAANLQDVPRIFYLFFARMKYFLSTFTYGNPSESLKLVIRIFTLLPFCLFVASFGSLLLFFIRNYRQCSPAERLFYLFVIMPPVLLAPLYSSRNLVQDEGMRFFLPLVISYSFCLAWWLQHRARPLWKKGVLGFLFGTLCLGAFLSGQEQIKTRQELEGLVQFVREKELRFGIAEFGIAYSLNILGRGEVVVSPPWYHAAYRPLLDQVEQGVPRFFILSRSSERFRKRLEEDPHLEKAKIGSYDVFWGESPLLNQYVRVGARVDE